MMLFEILTSNTDLAVILVYLNHLSALYLQSPFYPLPFGELFSGWQNDNSKLMYPEPEISTCYSTIEVEPKKKCENLSREVGHGVYATNSNPES